MIRDEEIGLPYLNGVYVAIDAIPDAVLVVDGPYCAVHKTALQTSHHLASTLFSPIQDGRVVPTHREAALEEVAAVSLDRDAITRKALESVFRNQNPGVLFTTAFDYLELAQRPLSHIAESLKREGIPAWYLAGSSMADDWLDGYRIVLETLAACLPLPKVDRVPGKVGIVGYFWDRNEGDHQGNREELSRILSALGLHLGPIWLSGIPSTSLADIASCQLLVQFPYGGNAGQTLAKRLEIPLIQTDLPLGIEATSRFVQLLAEATHTGELAAGFIDQETRHLVTALALPAAQFLAGAAASVVLDPFLGAAAARACEELGVEIRIRKSVRASLQTVEDSSSLRPDPPLVAPAEGARLSRHLFIASSIHQTTQEAVAPLHFGYPNFLQHPLLQRPFLGYRGAANFAESLIESVLRTELDGLRKTST